MIAISEPPNFLKLLAHDLRWQLLTALAYSDRRVQELVQLLDRPQNLVSYHLGRLRQQELVSERRSTADGRDVYYSLNLARMRQLYLASGQALHPALNGAAMSLETLEEAPVAEPMRVLFLCTHNSARSQMAEGILRAAGGDRVEVFSAGNEPSEVHPLAIEAMAAINVDISRQHSKHMGEFTGQHFDYIITVCDRVRESCPIFPGDPEQIHWSFPDPAAVMGTERQRYQAFVQTARELTTRIHYLLMVIDRQNRGG